MTTIFLHNGHIHYQKLSYMNRKELIQLIMKLAKRLRKGRKETQ
jgi:menaquinone-dependent protoporphyrinogen IX oxidase